MEENKTNQETGVGTAIDALHDIDAINAIENINDLRELYNASNKAFKEEVSKVDTKEELEKMEESLIELMNEHDKHIREVKYKLPEEVTFEDEKFSRTKISSRIKTFLERNEVEFTYIYGLYNLCKFWANSPSEIEYGALDSTLRLLEQLKYGGKDWRTMMIINAYFSKSNNDYNKDLTRTIFLADRHNIILERMQMISPVADALPEAQ